LSNEEESKEKVMHDSDHKQNKIGKVKTFRKCSSSSSSEEEEKIPENNRLKKQNIEIKTDDESIEEK
jgi:uncharacterized 2Fe-2S/4Fe-4S cluster protein (DUF4445 family)